MPYSPLEQLWDLGQGQGKASLEFSAGVGSSKERVLHPLLGVLRYSRFHLRE